MIPKQTILDLHGELIVDNFAGGGGASTGIEMALGRHVDIAINHDAEAVAMHTANHPQTRHYCESIWDVDPREVTQGRAVGLVWLSPDCKHFSKAKGGKPVEKKIRGLAWVTLRWAATVRPRVIMLENVEEFTTWGPLLIDGEGNARPCPKRRGREFGAFVNALKHHGYAVEWRELRACDYGAPTIRKRLFLIARRDGLPITWPTPTHGAPGGKLKQWCTAAECIDWKIPCHSIFERKKPLADATCRRIAKGIIRYVVNAAEPFIVPLTHQGGDRVESIREPFRTITGAQRGEKALCVPVIASLAHAGDGERAYSIDAPLRTIHAGGGNHALVSAFLAKHYGGVVGSDLRAPIGTVTAVDHHTLVTAHLVGAGGPEYAGKPASVEKPLGAQTTENHRAIVTSHLCKLRGDNIGQPTDSPLQTVSAQGTHFAEVRAFLIKYYGNERDGAALNDPMHTVTARDRFGLVTVAGEDYAIVDISLRMLTPRELFRAQGFPDTYIIGDDPAQGLTLTKTAQVRMCGNSVCPPIAAAIVRQNVQEMIIRKKIA